jgi:hypothetical protein
MPKNTKQPSSYLDIVPDLTIEFPDKNHFNITVTDSRGTSAINSEAHTAQSFLERHMLDAYKALGSPSSVGIIFDHTFIGEKDVIGIYFREDDDVWCASHTLHTYGPFQRHDGSLLGEVLPRIFASHEGISTQS